LALSNANFAGLRLRKVTPDDHLVMPWKNGLGTTREIAIDPPGASMADAGFCWRLSIADVAQSGPFSSFPGIDRTIMVIKGNGMVLRVAGQPSRRLARFEPFAFSGDAATACELIDGPIQDFNLMVRRSLLSARTEIKMLQTSSEIAMSAQGCILHVLAGAVALRIGSQNVACEGGETAIIEGAKRGAQMALEPREPARLALMQLQTAQ
jgi:environmental stress-induced protein Ves